MNLARSVRRSSEDQSTTRTIDSSRESLPGYESKIAMKCFGGTIVVRMECGILGIHLDDVIIGDRLADDVTQGLAR